MDGRMIGVFNFILNRKDWQPDILTGLLHTGDKGFDVSGLRAQ